LALVPEVPATDATYEVVCPHCAKPFQSLLIQGRAARYNGFKCPHCRLFVPYERVEEKVLAEPAA
jgi:DNA-directed RNA polymerase subunit RPC12/RpoP